MADVTIAPIEQYATDWSDIKLATEPTPVGESNGTGLSLSPSTVWLADTNALGLTTQSSDPLLFTDSSLDQTPNLIDETQVNNINVTALAGGGTGTSGSGSGLLSDTTQPLTDGLTFSLDVSGGTQSGAETLNVSSASSGSGTTDSSINTNSPLLTATSTTTSSSGSSSTTSSGSTTTNSGNETSSASDLLPPSETPTATTDVAITEGSTAIADPGGTSKAVPLEVSPTLGLLLLVALVMGRKLLRYQSILGVKFADF